MNSEQNRVHTDLAARALREYRILGTLLRLVRRFAEGHEVCRDTLKRELSSLRSHLEEHFRLEEEEGGLYRELEGHVPELAGEVERLGRQHGELLDRLAAIESRVAEGAGDDALRAGIRGFLDLVEKHEQDENDLFLRAYFVDEPAVD